MDKSTKLIVLLIIMAAYTIMAIIDYKDCLRMVVLSLKIKKGKKNPYSTFVSGVCKLIVGVFVVIALLFVIMVISLLVGK